MKFAYALPIVTSLFSTAALAGSMQMDSKTVMPTTPVVRSPVEINFKASSDYVGNADFRFSPAGDQEAFHAHVEAGVSIPIKDAFYFTFNGFYDRFDFSTSEAPVPTTLLKIGADIALEYRAEGEVAVALIASPGIYGSQINTDGFNVPITAYGSYRLSPSLVFVAGARYNEWSQYEILPAVGVIWTVNDQWKVRAVSSAPRVEYTPNDDVTFSLGGELAGGTYQTAKNEQTYPDQELDYYDIRGGVGVTYRGWKPVDVNLTAGWSFERNFRYDDIDDEYRVEGAPYVAFTARATF